jgi:tRNA(Met) C34 N-acetyltransferase TmcA
MEWLIAIGVVAFIAYVAGRSSTDRHQPAQNTYTAQPSLPVTDKPRPMPKPRLNVKQADISSIKLSNEQSDVFNLLETTNENYYITGKAGTGKSVLLQYFVENTGKRVVVVAPTGVAALNVGGQTIHSFFKMPFDIDFDELKVDYKLREILRNIDTVVIDEVSMVRVDLMEAISK